MTDFNLFFASYCSAHGIDPCEDLASEPNSIQNGSFGAWMQELKREFADKFPSAVWDGKIVNIVLWKEFVLEKGDNCVFRKSKG